MKYLLFLLTLLTSSFSVKCQNWEPFPNDSVFYSIKEMDSTLFVSQNLLLPLIKIDTTNVFRKVNIPMLTDFTAGSNFQYEYEMNPFNSYFHYELINKLFNQSPAYIQENKYLDYWIKTYELQNKIIRLYTNRDNQFTFHLNGKPDTLYFQSDNHNIFDTLGYVSKLDTSYALGSDSIKIFKIHALSNSSVLSHSGFVFSKNQGLLEMPIPSFFPYCVTLELLGKTSELNPYENSTRYTAYKHYPGDEIQRFYKVDAPNLDNTIFTEYFREVYVSQTFDSINSKFIDVKDIWYYKKTLMQNFMGNIPDSFHFASNVETSLIYCYENNEINYGDNYFLTPDSQILHLEYPDHWEPTVWNPLYYLKRNKYPHKNYGTEVKTYYPYNESYIHGVTYTKINGVESGTPYTPEFYLNTEQFNQNVDYINNENGVKLSHPEKYKSGRIYGIDGKFIKYLSPEDLTNFIKKQPGENTVQLIILIGKDSGDKSVIKF